MAEAVAARERAHLVGTGDGDGFEAHATRQRALRLTLRHHRDSLRGVQGGRALVVVVILPIGRAVALLPFWRGGIVDRGLGGVDALRRRLRDTILGIHGHRGLLDVLRHVHPAMPEPRASARF